MKFHELKNEIAKYLHTEDDGMIRIAIASIVATRLQVGDPVWMIMIGPSSSGKSQVLRPLALTDSKFIHRVDDLTENTFLSGMKVKKGEKDISLLKRIGYLGIIVISDLTVLFSKNNESKNAILSQFRMIYDGEMVKYSGTNSEPIKWAGSLGVIAGSTPSIYSHFEDVADMGERFIYYRMKDYDIETATRRSLGRKIFGKELDNELSEFYARYIKESIMNCGGKKNIPEISEKIFNRIVNISMLAAILRTPTHYDKFEKAIDKVPIPEMPMRVALQLSALAKGLSVLSFYDTGSWELEEKDIEYIEWCAYSLANEERRACLKILASVEYNTYMTTTVIADKIGLNTSVIGRSLQHLSAIGILNRSGSTHGLSWAIKDMNTWGIIRRLEKIMKNIDENTSREISSEEVEESRQIAQKNWEENF